MQSNDCSECKVNTGYRFGLCETCYGKMFETAKEKSEIGDNDKL